MNCQSFKDKFQPVLLWHSRRVCVGVHEHLPNRASARSPLFSLWPAAQLLSVCAHTHTNCLLFTNESMSPADEDEPEDAVSDVEEVPKSKKKKKAKKSSRESRSSKRQRPIREVSLYV